MSFPRYPKYKPSGVEWLGEVPEHWDLLPLKRLFRLVNRDPLPNDEIVTAFRDGTVTLRNNRRADGFTNALKEIGYQRVQRGDLVIHAMDAFAGAIGVADSDGKSSPVYSVCTARREDILPDYFARALRHMAVTGYVQALAKGIRERSTDFRWSESGVTVVPIPTSQEQRAIAAFLDRETTKIDALVAEQERLIELLAEKRQAVISHAVTKGLDPAAPMKPSGVEWLGTIPASWNLVGLTKYVDSIVDYRGRTPTKVDEGVFLVTARNIRNGRIDYDASSEFIEEAEYDDVMRRGKPMIGDVLLTTEAPLGQVANIDRTNIALAQRVIKLRGSSGVLDNYFLKYWIMGAFSQADMERLATGSTALGIKGSKVVQLRLCLPPVEEQRQIRELIDLETAGIDALVIDAERAVSLLKERRSALISAAVTGQIDVRHAVPESVA